MLDLLIGLFVGIAAFVGMVMNFSYVFAGTAGVNPLFIIISLFLIMASSRRSPGWYGLDRVVLPKLGTPWRTPAPCSSERAHARGGVERTPL